MGFPAMKLGMNVGTIALGAAAVLFGPAILTAAGGLARSLVKSGIKGSILAYEKGKVMIAEARESVEDITAEARAEISKPRKATSSKKA
ncbi:MAG: DUF5132 domain-containing protein [Deltaproteobacteria bacterium]|nr:DUF5132 domain-containing protein [Deltaproteobacteria bacterium]